MLEEYLPRCVRNPGWANLGLARPGVRGRFKWARTMFKRRRLSSCDVQSYTCADSSQAVSIELKSEVVILKQTRALLKTLLDCDLENIYVV